MKRLLFFLLLPLVFTSITSAQDLRAARKTINKMAAPDFWGRGYTKEGMAKAAVYLCDEFKKAGLKPMEGNDYRQNFSYPVNTFPGKMEVAVNGKKLVPGKDFIIEPASQGLHGNMKLEQKDSIFMNRAQRMFVILKDKLTWSVAQKANDYTVLEINKKALTSKPDSIDVDIDNEVIPEFITSNICGVVKGTKHPDSVLMLTAHYDHLGGMGAHTFFPGANDNASGIALLLNLAKYYAKNPAPYTIAFVCFAGEEPGLKGSSYFTTFPPLPLTSIRFLINVDMVGTGEKGITVVNATILPKEFALLNKINDQHQYLSKITPRNKAANSDHYFFTEKGVPAFFIYTQGGVSAYHDVDDIPETLPLTEFADLFKLFVKFNAALMKSS
ncbi:M28 family metallopeptidase [Pedobacter cryoconitis]|uniref:Peptidase M28-like protein n=1 Tax=Pedobacter cryoconitis TaxID=188932 RepID=A0A327T2W2_9SPHI|nr:M28 family peptidase [Pedobacter cryoconitis]RAJ34384.1 peptidase M28-like protein [Pedobacter cryoconitis]